MEKKSFNTEIEFKQDADTTGMFTAMFSKFDEVDKHGDITKPGAFEDGAKVKIAYWGHDWYALPVGKGVIHQDDEKAWVDGQFFLDTEAGRETYLTVKNLGELQEWSYGFETIETEEGEFEDQKVRILKKVKAFEVSPVFLGAGNSTQTLAIKSDKQSLDEPDENPDSQTETENDNESKAEELKSEIVKEGDDSGVDPVDMKFLIETIERTYNDGR